MFDASDSAAREVHALGATIDTLRGWLTDPAMRDELFRNAGAIWKSKPGPRGIGAGHARAMAFESGGIAMGSHRDSADKLTLTGAAR